METIALHKIKAVGISDDEVKILTDDIALIRTIKPSLIYKVIQKPIAFYHRELRKGFIVNGQISLSFINDTLPGHLAPITVELTITKQEEKFIETYDGVEEELFYMVVA